VELGAVDSRHCTFETFTTEFMYALPPWNVQLPVLAGPAGRGMSCVQWLPQRFWQHLASMFLPRWSRPGSRQLNLWRGGRASWRRCAPNSRTLCPFSRYLTRPGVCFDPMS